MARSRKCICCNATYIYCPNCGGVDKLKPTWFSEFCSEDCKDLWTVATEFNMGMIDKKDAKDMLSVLNLKDKTTYVSCVQRDLEVIFEDEPKQNGAKATKLPVNDKVVVKDKPTHEVVTTKNK